MHRLLTFKIIIPMNTTSKERNHVALHTSVISIIGMLFLRVTKTLPPSIVTGIYLEGHPDTFNISTCTMNHYCVPCYVCLIH